METLSQVNKAESEKIRPIRLKSWAALRVSGEDAESFLQGQISADVRKLAPDRAVLSSYNSPKGRVLAVLLITREEAGNYLLWLPDSILDPVHRRLRMFVLRSKVRLERAELLAAGLIGASAATWLRDRELAQPARQLMVSVTNGITLIRSAGSEPRYFVYGPDQSFKNIECEEDVAQTWRRAEILAGVPLVGPDTQDRWVAQMMNLDQWPGGISFDKGCYTGQEVIARLHYLGKLKKRMFLLRGQGEAPTVGSSIQDAQGDAQSVGEIVDACSDAHGTGFIACAVLQVAVSNSESLQLRRDADAALAKPEAYDYSVL